MDRNKIIKAFWLAVVCQPDECISPEFMEYTRTISTAHMAARVALYERNAGQTYGQIANRYGISERNVIKYCNRTLPKYG